MDVGERKKYEEWISFWASGFQLVPVTEQCARLECNRPQLHTHAGMQHHPTTQEVQRPFTGDCIRLVNRWLQLVSWAIYVQKPWVLRSTVGVLFLDNQRAFWEKSEGSTAVGLKGKEQRQPPGPLLLCAPLQDTQYQVVLEYCHLNLYTETLVLGNLICKFLPGNISASKWNSDY